MKNIKFLLLSILSLFVIACSNQKDNTHLYQSNQYRLIKYQFLLLNKLVDILNQIKNDYKVKSAK